MGIRNRRQKIRRNPRISAPKMGEYLDVAAHRRERILRDQKYPSDFITARYKDANHAIRSAMVSGGDVAARVLEKARNIATAPTAKKYNADTNACCAEALDRFARTFPTLPLKGITAKLVAARGLPLFVEEVEISVWPTVLLHSAWRDGTSKTGALLVVYNKGAALPKHSGDAVAELLRQALIQAGHVGVTPSMCLVLDVFSGALFTAPTSSRRLTGEIEAACREIAGLWPTIGVRE